MISKDLTVANKLGLHARAAASFVRLSSSFDCDIKVKKDDFEVDGKSILGLLSLAASKGTKIEIIAFGKDSDKAVKKIKQLVKNGFGEGV